ASVRRPVWREGRRKLFLDGALNVEGFDTVDFGEGAVDGDDLRHQFHSLLAEFGEAVAAGIVFFIHEHIHSPIIAEQTDRLAVTDALLPTLNVFLPVFPDLQIAREIDDLADHSRGLP